MNQFSTGRQLYQPDLQTYRHHLLVTLSPSGVKVHLSSIRRSYKTVIEGLEHRQAIDGHWSYVEFLSRLLEDEVARRAQKQLALRLRRAEMNPAKTLASFDFHLASTRGPLSPVT
ncbi:MAG: hypothetical protein CL610_15940 [Anaerolineaceae bacterium]|nr:hypothetical protein [Anaerolineaceae bacterium]